MDCIVSQDILLLISPEAPWPLGFALLELGYVDVRCAADWHCTSPEEH